jgi:peptide-methionine (S)-S-oxide reductase
MKGINESTMSETAILGGGCFWCLEAVYQRLRGVSSVVSGYMGGHVSDPRYEAVCSAQTGHAEVVKIEFDPSVISFGDLLDVFFEIHDPTTLNRQGNDVGPQYRSVIFALSPNQMSDAKSAIKAREPSGLFAKKIVTELIDLTLPGVSQTTAGRFWPAEAEHQNYFVNHPHQGYCAFVVAPKVEKAQAKFKTLLVE